MNIPLILIFIVILAALFIVFKLLKGALRIAFSVLGVIFLILIVLLGMAYLDAKKVQGLMQDGTKTVVYEQGDQLLTGVQVQEGGFLVQGEGGLPQGIDVLDDRALQEYASTIDNGSLGDHELLFVVKNDTFSNLTSISLNNVTITKDDFDAIMASDDPKEEAVRVAVASADVPGGLEQEVADQVREQLGDFTDEELKGALFLTALSTVVEDQGERAILQGVRDESIDIKPDFWLVRMVRFLPEGAFDSAMGKALNTTAEQGVSS